MPDETPNAVHSKPPRFAPLRTVVEAATDPASIALIPIFCACVAIVAAEASVRLAGVLTVAALMLLATRMRHAVTLAAVMLCAFAAVTLLHVPQITTPPPSTMATAATRP